MTLSYNLAYLETILVHPTRRQSFANTVQPHWTQDLTPRHKASFKVVLFSCHDRVWSGKVERRALVQEVVRNSVNIYPLSFCAVAQGLEKPSVVWQLKLSRYIFSGSDVGDQFHVLQQTNRDILYWGSSTKKFSRQDIWTQLDSFFCQHRRWHLTQCTIG